MRVRTHIFYIFAVTVGQFKTKDRYHEKVRR